MNIYASTAKGPLQVPGYIDPDDVTVIEAVWGASVFVLGKVYNLDELVKPGTESGYYHVCVKAGVSDLLAEPVWTQKKTESGTAVFKAFPYDLFLGYGESISTSTWEVTDGVTLVNEGSSGEKTSVRITAIPAGVLKFTLTNQVTKATGEKLSRSFLFNVNEQ